MHAYHLPLPQEMRAMGRLRLVHTQRSHVRLEHGHNRSHVDSMLETAEYSQVFLQKMQSPYLQ